MTSGATLLVTLGAVLGRVPCALHMMRKASMHAKTLAKMVHSRQAMIDLLLT